MTERDANNHGLSEEQCRIAFPKLFIEIDKAASLRAEAPISFAEVDDIRVDEDGMVRGVIDHGEVYYILPCVYSLLKSVLMIFSIIYIAAHYRLPGTASNILAS